MSENSKYRVLPKEIDPKPIPQVDSVPLSDWEKKDIKGLGGCAGFFFAVPFSAAFLLWASQPTWIALQPQWSLASPLYLW